jgi:hypothetical protein
MRADHHEAHPVNEFEMNFQFLLELKPKSLGRLLGPPVPAEPDCLGFHSSWVFSNGVHHGRTQSRDTQVFNLSLCPNSSLNPLRRPAVVQRQSRARKFWIISLSRYISQVRMCAVPKPTFPCNGPDSSGLRTHSSQDTDFIPFHREYLRIKVESGRKLRG